MAGMFGGGNSKQKPQYTSLQLQTSALGMPIPIIYGVNRGSANLIWYNNFRAQKQKSSAGKGGTSGDGTYDYVCSVIMGICEGGTDGIDGIAQLWASGSLTNLFNTNLTIFNGSATQTPFDYVETLYPDQALSYGGLAYAATGSYDLGANASLPSHEFEVIGLLNTLTGVAEVDTHLAADISNTNVITVPSGVGAGIYLYMMVQSSVSDGTPDNLPGIPTYTVVLGISGDTITLSNSIFTPLAAGTPLTFSFIDVNPGIFLIDYLTNVPYGLAMDSSLIGDMTDYIAYCKAQTLFLSPIYDQQEQCSTQIDRIAQLSNSWIFWDGTQVVAKPLAGTTVVGNGVTYVPNTTPVYNLGYDDFIFDEGTDPVMVDRSDPSDAYNQIVVECNDRLNKAYQSNAIQAKDEPSIDQYGLLAGSSIQARECCDPNIAMIIAQLICQRSVYIRNTYRFKLGIEFSLLTVGDIVTLTDANIPLAEFAVRIKQIDEDEDFNLDFIAEEFPIGTGSIPQFTPQPAVANPKSNTGAAPGAVNVPLIWEPPAIMTGGIPQVWIGASGQGAWGGANVFLSADGTNYENVGVITQPCIQGFLTADCLGGITNPDTSNTLQIDLSESETQIIPGATDADADAFRTIVLVDNELLAYGDTVQGSGTYLFTLSYLQRGVYGTTDAGHSSGTAFTRLDGAIFKYNLPQAYIGKTVYMKLQSFNILGGAPQDISTCTVYTYDPLGTGFEVASPGTPTGTSAVSAQSDGTQIVSVTTSWAASPDPLIAGYNVQWSTDSGMTWTNGVTVAKNQTSYTLSPAAPSTVYLFRTQAINTAGNISGFTTSSSITSASTTVANKFFDIPMSYIGVPAGSQVFYRAVLARAILIPMNFVGSPTPICQVAPTGTVVLTVKQVSAGTTTTVGTITWTSPSTTAVFASSADVAFAVDDIIEIDMQSSADATFGSPSVTISAIQIITSGGGYGNGYGEAYGE